MTHPTPPGGGDSPPPPSDSPFPSYTWGPSDPYAAPGYGCPAPAPPPGSGFSSYPTGPSAAGPSGYPAGHPYAFGPGYGQPTNYPYDYGYGSPYHYPGFLPPQPTDGLAIASLIISCLSMMGICAWGLPGLIGILGAILGHVARRRIRTTGANGNGMALAGVVVGWTSASIGVLLITIFVVLALTDGFAP